MEAEQNKEKSGKSKIRKRILITVLIILLLALSAAGIYLMTYYHANDRAKEALQSDKSVQVEKTDYGWYFDGPGKDDALVFYPGARVEETAYAPFLHLLAERGLDVCLVKMPFRMAVFGKNRATNVMKQYSYKNWYIGGHSMGGAMAASYASAHSGKLKGVILCAAYTVDRLDDYLQVISVYGDRDRVIDRKKLEKGRELSPDSMAEYEIPGANHAGFGDYGSQRGDGKAEITPEEQQRLAVEFIIRNLK